MNFDDWWRSEFQVIGNWNNAGLIKHNAEKAWNAAIDEAIKVAKEGHTYTPTSTAHNIAKRIKELKE